MENSNNKISIDSLNRVYLDSSDLNIGHILTNIDYEEMLAFYKENNLTPVLPKRKNKAELIGYSDWYYIFKDENKQFFGDTLLAPLNKTGTVVQIMPLFMALPNETVYKKLFEFFCYAAKYYSKKRLIVTVPTYLEYEMLLKMGFADMPPEHLNKIKGLMTESNNSIKKIFSDYFTVQIDLSKMPKTELEKTAVINRI